MNRPCSKVKNPCKICCDTVTKKTGIQCHGACQRWSHYKCLNYPLGKIDEIKAGLIRINCPCPDCNNSDTKKNMCKTECPAKRQVPTPPQEREPVKPIPNYPPLEDESRVMRDNVKCPKCQKCTSPDNKDSHATSPNFTPSDSFIKYRQRATYQKKTSAAMKSYSNCVITMSADSGINITCMPSRTASSDSKLSKGCEVNQKELCEAVENMCATVGKLTHQLRDLLYKIRETNNCPN
ncbi:unnamed protein product [Colias eurytheme]|nr:unnamed protein product [Colias eurytheme]